ncbi:hypothetical protein [Ketobacter sp.]|uniref:hypothetical protein n=1 Tax=Ketobacter sp. TaxID=2083498 RepID=UPI0025B9EB34|nr:hypothetical protein [Ketobacter sp.]
MQFTQVCLLDDVEHTLLLPNVSGVALVVFPVRIADWIAARNTNNDVVLLKNIMYLRKVAEVKKSVFVALWLLGLSNLLKSFGNHHKLILYKKCEEEEATKVQQDFNNCARLKKTFI